MSRSGRLNLKKLAQMYKSRILIGYRGLALYFAVFRLLSCLLFWDSTPLVVERSNRFWANSKSNLVSNLFIFRIIELKIHFHESSKYFFGLCLQILGNFSLILWILKICSKILILKFDLFTGERQKFRFVHSRRTLIALNSWSDTQDFCTNWSSRKKAKKLAVLKTSYQSIFS